MLSRSGIVRRRIYIIADSEWAASSLAAQLDLSPNNSVVGSSILPDENIPAEQVLESALVYVSANPVELVLAKLSLSKPDRLAEITQVLRRLPHNVALVPASEGCDNLVLNWNGSVRHRADALDNMPVLRLSDPPLSGWSWVLKDVQDRTLALMLLIFVSPVMIAIALAIKLSDPGPVLFGQKRFGYGRTIFTVLKFRTMRVNTRETDLTVIRLTTRNDPRITPLGRILRKTSLDELPQLWNVIRGDMWIVGPRPHSPYATAGGQIYSRAITEYAARYRIKPGITGWAQVCGWRGPTETLEQLRNRVKHDLYYIENWSPLFDIRILFKTLLCAFGEDNAF